MTDYLVKDTSLTAIADAIREKAKISNNLQFPNDFISTINNISTSDGNVTNSTQSSLTISVGTDGKITSSMSQTAGYVEAKTITSQKQLTTQAAKTVTPSTSEQTAVASNVYTTGVVKVAAMPSATQATPTISIGTDGKITASATQTAGYVAAGTKSATEQMTVQAAKTITPSSSSQTAVASGVYTTGAITVAAIPNTYVKPTTTKAATTYTPTTTNQTIAAGTYCSGVQTIKGDSNLIASNIKSGVSIFGVSGNYTGSGSDNNSVSFDASTIVVNIDNNHQYIVTLPITSNEKKLIYAFIDGKTDFNLYRISDSSYNGTCYINSGESISRKNFTSSNSTVSWIWDPDYMYTTKYNIYAIYASV